MENYVAICEIDEQSILIPNESDDFQYDDVYNDPNWIKAMQSKYDSIIRNETWELMPLPLGKWAITTHWVFKLKPSSHDLPPRHKAWLVAHKCHQKQEVDYYETFVHVVKWETICVVIGIAAHANWLIQHLDVRIAFVNGFLEE